MNEMDAELAAAFSTPVEADWKALVHKGLRGAVFDKALVRHTADGLARGPLRTAKDNPAMAGAPGALGFMRGTRAGNDPDRPWHNAQGNDARTVAAANAELLEDLQGGGSALWLRIDPAGKSGAAVRNLDEMSRLLRGVDLALAPVLIKPAPQGPAMAVLLLSHAQKHNLPLDSLQGSLGLSPVGQCLFKGQDEAKLVDRFRFVADTARWCACHAPGLRSVTITASLVHEAGGSEALEIAFAAAGGLCYLKSLTGTGLPLEVAARSLLFNFAVDADAALGMAKLRAARRVWARVLAACGCQSAETAMHIHAVSSGRMMARMAPWTNLLRTTMAAFAAAVGGAQYISVRPHDYAFGTASPRARRLARNVPVILHQEAHVGRVIDPAGGAFATERLSDDLAQAAWAFFQQIEAKGGLVRAATSGWLGQQVSAQRARLMAALQSGERLMTGVNGHVQADEDLPPLSPPAAPPPMPQGPAFADDLPFQEAMEAAHAGAVIAPKATFSDPALAPVRLSAPFEGMPG